MILRNSLYILLRHNEPIKHQEQESGRTTIRSNPSDACFHHFLFICLQRRIPLGVTSYDLNWLAREQGFASYPSGSGSGSDLFYFRLHHTRRSSSYDVSASAPQKSYRISLCEQAYDIVRSSSKLLMFIRHRALAQLTHSSMCATISECAVI